MSQVTDYADPDSEESIEISTPSLAIALGNFKSNSVLNTNSSSASMVSQLFFLISLSNCPLPQPEKPSAIK